VYVPDMDPYVSGTPRTGCVVICTDTDPEPSSNKTKSCDLSMTSYLQDWCKCTYIRNNKKILEFFFVVSKPLKKRAGYGSESVIQDQGRTQDLDPY